jgi:hypothetical protein
MSRKDNEIYHKEWEKENTLTTPDDRDKINKMKLNQFEPVLNEDELKEAIKEVSNKDFIKKFRKIERKFADPTVDMQHIGLISFVPAKGAKPNENGVYGFAKLRGNFASEGQAAERAEYLIRNHDSYHQIYHTYVGFPFPLTLSSDYSKETNEIDIRKETTKSVSASIKEKRDKEQKEMQEIKEKEEKLLAESKEEEDPSDKYTTLRVKLSQVSWTYLETDKKMKEMKEIIIKTRGEIDEMEKESSVYKKVYYDKYMLARKNAGIKEENNTDENFMKYLVEDVEFDFLPKK